MFTGNLEVRKEKIFLYDFITEIYILFKKANKTKFKEHTGMLSNETHTYIKSKAKQVN